MSVRPASLTYAPLPYDTHPIDTTPSQQQGYGPFTGPYTPLDFRDVAGSIGLSGISNGYNLAVFNLADHGPGYHDITLFSDPSLDRVNAVLTKLNNDGNKQPGMSYSNTIANGVVPTQSGATAAITSLKSRIAAALGGS